MKARLADIFTHPIVFLTLVFGSIYLNTAVIQSTGGPGERLVIKPLHGIYPFYGGGGDNSWTSQHPGEDLPWWHYPEQDYAASLIYTSHETTAARWMIVYGIGYMLWPLLLLSSVVIVVLRCRQPKSASLSTKRTNNRAQ